LRGLKVIQSAGPGCVPRPALGLFVALAALLAASCPAAAQIAASAKAVLDEPSTLTQQAASGLFTSVANAGSRLVAAGQDGRIMVSDNNGASWRQVETPTSVTLTQVRFASASEGWAVGQMGAVLRTVDKGEHWRLQFDGFRANTGLLKIALADLAAQPKDAAAATHLQNALQFKAGGPSVPFLALLPLSSQAVVAAGGYGMAFVSNDAGMSWQSSFDRIPNPNGLNIYAVIKDGPNQLWAGEQGLALLRDQSGSFRTLTPPFQGSFFGAVRTPDGALMLYGLQGTILRSQDDGSHWTQIMTSATGGVDSGIILKNGDVLLGDEDGSVLLSKDDGKTFAATPTDGPVVSVAEAGDGAIITAGPQGLRRLTAASLDLIN
jgi:photosystem II stability/assembly factor-like uncharacterized protein